MDSLTLKQALLHKKWNFQHRIQCVEFTTKKNKSSIKNFFSECDHIHSKLKKSLMGNFIFNAEVWTYSLQRCSQDHLKHLRWCVLHVTKLSILHVCGIPIYNSAIRVNWEILTFLSRAHVIIQALQGRFLTQTQPAFTCPKSKMERSEKCGKYIQS